MRIYYNIDFNIQNILRLQFISKLFTAQFKLNILLTRIKTINFPAKNYLEENFKLNIIF